MTAESAVDELKKLVTPLQEILIQEKDPCQQLHSWYGYYISHHPDTA